MSESLIIFGGFFHLGFVVFHLFFWRLFKWRKDLASLNFINRAVMQILNLCLIFVFLAAGIISIFYAHDLSLHKPWKDFNNLDFFVLVYKVNRADHLFRSQEKTIGNFISTFCIRFYSLYRANFLINCLHVKTETFYTRRRIFGSSF